MLSNRNELERLKDESSDAAVRPLSSDELDGITGAIGWAFLGKIIEELGGASSGRGSSGRW